MSSVQSVNPESTSAPIPLRRGARKADRAPTLRLAALRAPLVVKLVGATLVVVAALLLQMSAAARDCTDPALAARLYAARDAAQELTEEVRSLSQSLHPRVLDDLGLASALQQLARDSTNGTGIDVDVDARRAAE